MNVSPPAVAEFGLNPEMLGVNALIVKVTALEIAPPGLTTVTLAVPGLAIRLAATEVVKARMTAFGAAGHAGDYAPMSLEAMKKIYGCNGGKCCCCQD